MNNDQILNYFKKHKKDFKNHLKLDLETATEKRIFRIVRSSKRLQALFYFIEQYSPTSFQESKSIKSLKKLFRKLGEVKDHFILHRLIKDYEGLLLINYKPFRKYIEKQEKYYTREFLKYIKKFDIKAINKIEKQIKLIEVGNNFSLNKKLKEYIEQKEEVIRMYAHFLNNDEKLQLIRIALKDIRYLTEIKKDIEETYKKRHENILELEKHLQNWNDNVILLNKIELFLQNGNEITKADVIDYDILTSIIQIKKEELMEGSKVLLTKLFKVNFTEKELV